jgi:hypothetical protein
MIARVWKAWTTYLNADAYERLPKDKVMPRLKHMAGYRGGYILRQDVDAQSEFVVMNLFESLNALRAIAGADYSVPVFELEAKLLLSKVEPVARHYEVETTPE